MSRCFMPPDKSDASGAFPHPSSNGQVSISEGRANVIAYEGYVEHLERKSQTVQASPCLASSTCLSHSQLKQHVVRSGRAIHLHNPHAWQNFAELEIWRSLRSW